MTHFTASGLVDYVMGESACKSLAKSNPAQAVANADTYWYFAWNTPVLS